MNPPRSWVRARETRGDFLDAGLERHLIVSYQLETMAAARFAQEISPEIVKALLELPGLVGWQVRLCEAVLYGDDYSEHDLADLVQSRWRELMERGVV